MHISANEIAFDFDGVVADTFGLFVELAATEYDAHISLEDITDYEFPENLPISREHALHLIDLVTWHPHEIDLQPNTGAPEILTRLAGMAPLLVVTARPDAEPVRHWFARHIPEAHPEIIATGSSTTKLPILAERGVRYFIDDRLDTCHQLAGADINPLVYAQPWNRQEHPYPVVHTWAEIDALIGDGE